MVECLYTASLVLNYPSEVMTIELKHLQLFNTRYYGLEMVKQKTYKMNKLFFENETINRPINFSPILSVLEDKLEELVQFTVSYNVSEGIVDCKNLLKAVSDDIARWTQLLADRKITTRDFEVLVIGDKDLVEMDALTFAGLASHRAYQFKASVLNLIIDTVLNTLKI